MHIVQTRVLHHMAGPPGPHGVRLDDEQFDYHAQNTPKRGATKGSGAISSWGPGPCRGISQSPHTPPSCVQCSGMDIGPHLRSGHAWRSSPPRCSGRARWAVVRCLPGAQDPAPAYARARTHHGHVCNAAARPLGVRLDDEQFDYHVQNTPTQAPMAFPYLGHSLAIQSTLPSHAHRADTRTAPYGGAARSPRRKTRRRAI
jgi:hypothetical protein